MSYSTLNVDKHEVGSRVYNWTRILMLDSTFKKMEGMLAHVSQCNETMDTMHKIQP